MTLQIALNICRACLTEDPKAQLTEYSAESEMIKSFQFLINSEQEQKLSNCRTFCQKCTTKIKIAAGFKKLSLDSEKYLVSLITKLNQEFKSSLLNFSGNRQSSGSDGKNPNEVEEQEIAYLIQEVETPKETSSNEIQQPQTITQLEVPKVFKPNQKQEKQEPVKLEIINRKTFMTAPEMYSTEDEAGDNIFAEDKEIYDIMEIEGNDDIYVDESGNAIDEEGEFILVNYKSETDDLSNEKEYILEEDDEGQDSELYEEHVSKPTRKKHVERMPREIVDRYAQSTDTNQHICTKCVKVFSTRTNLIRHIQSHDGNKPYVCEVCKKGFTQSGSLKQHMYIHSGERPYKCSYCDKAFTQGKTLKFHMRRHLDEKPFICEECNTTFRQRDGLKRHLKARHNIELKYERNSSNEKIVAYVEMKEEDGKTLEIMEEESSQGTDDKKMEF